MTEERTWDVEVFYDGDCPLCKREIEMLQWLDRKRKLIRFTDIAPAEFDASSYGLTHQDFMDEIQGRKADGTWLIGVEVFRQLYTAVGFGWLVAPSRLPGVRQTLDLLYQKFAKYRLRLTGRCQPDGVCRTDSPAR